MTYDEFRKQVGRELVARALPSFATEEALKELGEGSVKQAWRKGLSPSDIVGWFIEQCDMDDFEP